MCSSVVREREGSNSSPLHKPLKKCDEPLKEESMPHSSPSGVSLAGGSQRRSDAACLLPAPHREEQSTPTAALRLRVIPSIIASHPFLPSFLGAVRARDLRASSAPGAAEGRYDSPIVALLLGSDRLASTGLVRSCRTPKSFRSCCPPGPECSSRILGAPPWKCNVARAPAVSSPAVS